MGVAVMTNMFGGALLLGPDSKIYMSVNYSNYVGRVNHPNSAGLMCDFVENAVLLGPDILTANTCSNGFPGIYRYNSPPVNPIFLFLETCDNDTTFFTTPLGFSLDTMSLHHKNPP